eukprot:6173001-Pleurochrysis_carterae.AAC.2
MLAGMIRSTATAEGDRPTPHEIQHSRDNHTSIVKHLHICISARPAQRASKRALLVRVTKARSHDRGERGQHIYENAAVPAKSAR